MAEENKFWLWLKGAVAVIGVWGHKYLGGLFMEMKDGKQVVSIGRVSFVAVLGLLIWMWYRAMVYAETVVLPPAIMEVFWTLASYIFGSKVISVIKDKIANGKPK